MLSIHVERNAEHSEVATDDDEVTIGRDPSNAVVLRDPAVSRQHCRLFERDGAWWVVDLGSERGTYVNGRRIAVATALKETDRLHVGPCVLSIEIVPDTLDEPGTLLSDHRRPRLGDVEASLLDDIVRGDETSRAVYADWLEQQGRPADAEFLRLQFTAKQARTPDAASERAGKRQRELAESLDVAWRMKVARPPIEGCHPAFEAACPADWGAMAPTADPAVRSCSTCKKFVHYCMTEDEAFAQTERGACVALDISVVRRPAPQVVEIPCPRCGRLNSDHYRFCLGCAADLPSAALPALGGMLPAATPPTPDPPSPKPRVHPPTQPPRGTAHTVPRTNANTIPRRPPSSPPPLGLEEQLRPGSPLLRPSSPRPGSSGTAEPAAPARPSSTPVRSSSAAIEPATTARPSSSPRPGSSGNTEPATTARPGSAPILESPEPATTARPGHAAIHETIEPATTARPSHAAIHEVIEPATTARPSSSAMRPERTEAATTARPSHAAIHEVIEPATTARPSSSAMRPERTEAATTARPSHAAIHEAIEPATTARPSHAAIHEVIEPATARPSSSAMRPERTEAATTARPSHAAIHEAIEPATTARPSSAAMRPERTGSPGEPATTARPPLEERLTTARPGSAPIHEPFDGDSLTMARPGPAMLAPPPHEPSAGESLTLVRADAPPRPTGEQLTTAWPGGANPRGAVELAPAGEPLATARPESPQRALVEPAAGDDDEPATLARPSARRPPTDAPPPSRPSPAPARPEGRDSAPPKRGPQVCATCESQVPASFVFCGTCGARMR